MLPCGPLGPRAEDCSQTGRQVHGVPPDPHPLGQVTEQIRTKADQPEVRVSRSRERERVRALLIVPDLPLRVERGVEQPGRTVIAHARTAQLDGDGDRTTGLGARQPPRIGRGEVDHGVRLAC